MAGITLSELLKKMIEMGGSDLHLSTNSAPRVRVHGKLRALDMPPLTAADTKALAYSVLDRRAEASPGGKPRARLFVRLEEPGAVPRQHLSPARRGRGGVQDHSVGDQELRHAGTAARSCEAFATSRADWCW